jgi:hypothetical protein
MYYPLSQITPNLYTNGNEYKIISTQENYIGHYWKNSKGQLFTGKTPQNPPNQELTLIIEASPNSEASLTSPIQDKMTIFPIWDADSPFLEDIDFEIVTYLTLKNIPLNTSITIPTYSPTIPTPTDYQIGEYRRYFCKKTNEIIYLEINKDTHDKLVSKDSTILYQLYQPFNLPWQLTGDKSQVFITNKNITELTSKQQNFPMLSEYLRNDFTKYYK